MKKYLNYDFFIIYTRHEFTLDLQVKVQTFLITKCQYEILKIYIDSGKCTAFPTNTYLKV